jgi:hypothetical protein
VQSLVGAGITEDEQGRYRRAGSSLTLAQVASIAFDGAPIDALLSAAAG